MFGKMMACVTVLTLAGTSLGAGKLPGYAEKNVAWGPVAPAPVAKVIASRENERGRFEDRDRGDRRGGWSDRDDWRDERRDERWGNRWDRDRDDRGFVHAGFNIRIGEPPAYCPPAQPIVRFIEERPCDLQIRAIQAGSSVIVFATGSNRSGGFVTTLDRVGDDYGAPRLVLKNVLDTRAYATSCVTPFDVRGFIEVRGCVSEIKVCVADQEICVPVETLGVVR